MDIRYLFLSTAWKYTTVWLYHSICIHLPMCHLGWLKSILDYYKSGCYEHSCISLFRNTCFLFSRNWRLDDVCVNFLRKYQTLFQITISHSHKQCWSIPVPPHSCQYLILLNFSHSNRHVIVLICIPFMTNGIEHHLIYLFAIYVSSFMKNLLKSSTYFLLDSLFFITEFCKSLYILDPGYFSDKYFANIFS